MNYDKVIKQTGFRLKRNFGQNFIFDQNLLDAIVADAGVTGEDVVVEIGTGAGSLTRSIASVASRVFSYEIDQSLAEVHRQTLGDLPNVSVIYKDILAEDPSLIADGQQFVVVANLPYYITTPIILGLIRHERLKSMTIMVQREVGDRLRARHNTADYGSISVAVQAAARVTMTRKVARTCFVPPPNVDSAIIRMDIARRKDIDYVTFERLVRSAFAMRRKTLANNLCSAYGVDRAQVVEWLRQAGLGEQVRGEALSVEDFVRLDRVIGRKHLPNCPKNDIMGSI